jgi:putative ABC transport system permease protein
MRWYQRLFRRARTERQLDAELRFHLEQQIADYVATGMTADEARRRARLEFGGLDQVKEECRDVGAARFVEALIQDIRYGLRQLRRNPGFTAVAIITLALGIGANTAIFTVLNAVLLQPLPYRNPQRLVRLEVIEPGSASPSPVASELEFKDWQTQNHVFKEMAAGFISNKALTGRSEPLQLSGFEVSPQIFNLLGVAPLLGRTFSQDETQPGHNHVVILSYGLWQRAFGGDRAIAGKTIRLGDEVYDVVGVMPQSLRFPDLWWGWKAEFWIPLNLEDPGWRLQQGNHWLWVLARTNRGVTLAQAQADMATLSHNLQRQYPRVEAGVDAKVLSLRAEVTKQVKPALLVLFVAVGFLLVIACANVVNLLLARVVTRNREMAIRLAVGSGRSRLIQQLVTESVLLFLAGGAAGLLTGWAALQVLLYAAPTGYIPGIVHVQLDGWVFAFTFAIALLTGLVAGFVPAIQCSNPDLQRELKEGARTAAGHREWRSILTAAEIAVALVMLVGAGLAIKSFVRLMGVDPGFDSQSVLRAYLALPDARYKKSEQVTVFYERLLDQLRALPGVQSASTAEYLPLQGNPAGSVYIEGQPLPKTMWSSPEVAWCSVMPGYFRTLHIPLLRGHDFTLEDGLHSPRVAIINESMAHLFWPNQNPLGKRFSQGSQRPKWITVVGVVGDVHESDLAEAATPEAYFPETQTADPWLAVVLRTSTPPLTEAGALRHAVHSLDPELPVSGVGTLSELIAQSSHRQQFVALLLGLFAAAALVLALIGIYGVISYSVAQRNHELGIRLALGAQRSDVLRLVTNEGFRMALVGVTAGLLAALALTRFMENLLYGVKPNDPVIFIAAPLCLILVALAACLVPARRATKIDPMVALRHE